MDVVRGKPDKDCLWGIVSMRVALIKANSDDRLRDENKAEAITRTITITITKREEGRSEMHRMEWATLPNRARKARR